MNKKFVALARVSSREQEREGFSLVIQEEALYRFAQQQGGEIIKFFRIAETATKPEERSTFKELLAYAKKNAGKLSANWKDCARFSKANPSASSSKKDRISNKNCSTSKP